MKYDFSGYATKNDLKCSDGRTIRKGAFAHNDGKKVPLVWQHVHSDPLNVLGHAYLENRDDGVYAYGIFNKTAAGINAKQLVEHGDITALSIHANKLKQSGSDVLHGDIKEVSLVMSGANPGAFIDNLTFSHSDGSTTTTEDEAIIYTDESLTLEHKDKEDNVDKNKENKQTDDKRTVLDVFNTLSKEQKNVVYAIIGAALDGQEEGAIEHSDLGGDLVRQNIFEQGNEEDYSNQQYLTHSDMETIFENAKKLGSLRDAVLQHGEQTYGIEDINYLFPDARTIDKHPDFIKRDDTWVKPFFNALHKTPFARIKTIHADITEDEARAKGYVTGAKKMEEVFKLLKRETTPTTIYKKQKLDRDDITDITDFDVVAWMKIEMRWMLDEEISRAILVGDGREFNDDDKINESNIRPIYSDDDLYAHRVTIAKDRPVADLIEDIIRARKHYKGNGRPIFYTTTDVLTDMLLVKDQMGRRLYKTQAELEAVLRVRSIEEVEVMEGVSRKDDEEATFDLIGILVNPADYAVGANKGGQVSLFDDFDIDYNQYKYLMEARMSGALRYPKSALVFEMTDVVEIP